MHIKDRQATVQIQLDQSQHRFFYESRNYQFSSMEKVHRFFLEESDLDTVKIFQDDKKSYVHFFDREVKTYPTKKALRRALSRESGGAWVEEKSSKVSYFIDESGWLSTIFKKVSKLEFYDRLKATSVSSKRFGIGLGAFALSPSGFSLMNYLSLGASHAALGFAMAPKNSLMMAFGCACLFDQTYAQAIGTEFEVNTYRLDGQSNPHIASHIDGGFIATWQSWGQDGSNDGIYARRYDVNGTALGPEFLVNTYTRSTQIEPQVATLNNGNFVIVWQDGDYQDGDRWGIFGQRYDSNGNTLGGNFVVNSYTNLDQQYPSITSLQDGGFVVTWQSDGQDGDGFGIYGQRYNSDGSLNGGEFQINTNTALDQQYPSVASLGNGGFVVTWQSDGQDGSGLGIYGQRFDASRIPSGLEFLVNNYTLSSQQRPSVTPYNGSGFVVVWTGYGDGNTYGVHGRKFDENGNGIGSEFLALSNSFSSSVASLTQGKFVVAGSSSSIYAKVYNPNGQEAVGEFQVNTYNTFTQASASVAALIDGGFVVLWQSDGQDGDTWGVYGQRFNANGTALQTPLYGNQTSSPPTTNTTEFLVNQYRLSNQRRPHIVSTANTSTVVTWQSYNQDGDRWGIYALKYHANETYSRSEFRVNNYTQDSQQYPSSAALNNGDFVIVWQSDRQDGDRYGIFGQRFGIYGEKLGLEFQINTRTDNQQEYPDVASLSDGGFVVVWESDGQDSSGTGIYGQRFNFEGVPQGTEFQVHTDQSNYQRYPRVAGFKNGGFVVTWQSYGQDGSLYGIFAQRFDVSGNRAGVEFQVNSYTPDNQEHPSVAALNDVLFIIAWESEGQDGDWYGIFAQRFDIIGNTVGGEFQVNTYTQSYQRNSKIAVLNDDEFIITWESDGQDGDFGGIYGQLFNSSALPVGPEFLVNLYTTNRQAYQGITASNEGEFVVAWQSSGQDEGPSDGIYARRFHANATAIAPFQAPQMPTESSSTLVAATSGSNSIRMTNSIEVTNSIITSFTASTQMSQSTRESTAPSLSTEMSQSISVSSSSTFNTLIGPTLPSLADVQYGVSYEILSNGAFVGTYYVTGGQGPFNADNLNTLVIEFNGNYYPSDGETLVLFTDVPQDHVLEWENVEFVGGEECFTAEGVFIEETGGDDYGLLFETRSSDCELAIEASRLAPLAALLATN